MRGQTRTARRYSLAASLWIGAVLQALSNLAFAWLALVGVNQWALALAITVENFTGAIGTVIFVAYLSALCKNPLHTATQYALLTALAAVGRTYLSAGAGYVAQATGWPPVLHRVSWVLSKAGNISGGSLLQVIPRLGRLR